MRRIAARGLGLVLLGTAACPGRAHAGDPELPAMERYLAEAKARGEPTTWDALMGPPAPTEGNGVVSLVAARREVEPRASRFRSAPGARWDPAEGKAAEAFVAREQAYFAALRAAGGMPVFRPRLIPDSLGQPTVDDVHALHLASHALDRLACIGTESAAEAVRWVLRTHTRWRPRTWTEGVRWDEGARRCAEILGRMAQEPRFGIAPGAFASDAEAGLATLERMVLASVRARLHARRLQPVDTARAFRSGKDVYGDNAKALAELRRILGEGRGEEPLVWPELPVPGVDSPDYRTDLEALDRDTVEELEVYDVALGMAGDIPSMRMAMESAPDTIRGRAADPMHGQFEVLLTLCARVRLARIALVLIGLRAAGPPAADAVRALLAREELWDPLSGLPFEARAEPGKLVVVRAAVPPRTTAPDAPALLTVAYGDAAKAPAR